MSLSSRDLQAELSPKKQTHREQAHSSGKWELGVGVGGWEVGTSNKEYRDIEWTTTVWGLWEKDGQRWKRAQEEINGDGNIFSYY